MQNNTLIQRTKSDSFFVQFHNDSQTALNLFNSFPTFRDKMHKNEEKSVIVYQILMTFDGKYIAEIAFK